MVKSKRFVSETTCLCTGFQQQLGSSQIDVITICNDACVWRYARVSKVRLTRYFCARNSLGRAQRQSRAYDVANEPRIIRPSFVSPHRSKEKPALPTHLRISLFQTHGNFAFNETRAGILCLSFSLSPSFDFSLLLFWFARLLAILDILLEHALIQLIRPFLLSLFSSFLFPFHFGK